MIILAEWPDISSIYNKFLFFFCARQIGIKQNIEYHPFLPMFNET